MKSFYGFLIKILKIPRPNFSILQRIEDTIPYLEETKFAVLRQI